MDASEQMTGWLKGWDLPDTLEGKLQELGAGVTSSLVDIDDDDIESLPLKKLERKRFIKAVDELREAAGWTPPDSDLGKGWDSSRQKRELIDYLQVQTDYFQIIYLEAHYKKWRHRMDVLNLLLSTVSTVFGASAVGGTSEITAADSLSTSSNSSDGSRRLAVDDDMQEFAWVKWLLLMISISLTLILGYKKLADWDAKIDKLREAKDQYIELMNYWCSVLSQPIQERQKFSEYFEERNNMLVKIQNAETAADVSPSMREYALYAIRNRQNQDWQAVEFLWDDNAKWGGSWWLLDQKFCCYRAKIEHRKESYPSDSDKADLLAKLKEAADYHNLASLTEDASPQANEPARTVIGPKSSKLKHKNQKVAPEEPRGRAEELPPVKNGAT